jgi:hypothetical protein
MWQKRLTETLRQILFNHKTNENWGIAKHEAELKNRWFTPESINLALDSWIDALNENEVQHWLSKYKLPTENRPQTLGIVMAGNIPIVGLHDLLCGLIAGYRVRAKLSSDDEVLMKHLIENLVKEMPELAGRIELSTDFKGLDMAIATGSNNSGRYFEYYFRHIPHLLRGHRTGVAVLSGNETAEELLGLGHDIFDHFGLGCRNITHLMLPSGFEFSRLFEAWLPLADIIHHNKYANNYHYHRALLLMNLDKHLDNGFVVLKESTDIYSPVGVIGYSVYKNFDDVTAVLNENENKIQVVCGDGFVPFGQAQHPRLWDYADGVDTLNWLLQ